MALTGEEIVEKSNELNNLVYKNASLPALRFFSIYLAKINPRDEKTRVVKFKVSDFEKIMEIKRFNTTKFYEATDKLLDIPLHIRNEQGKPRNRRIFRKFDIYNIDGEDYITADIEDDAIPLLFHLRERYFSYQLWNALRLRSTNQVRMYEILKQYEKVGRREISVDELRDLLGIEPDTYKRWDVFKVKVLDACQRALEDTTDIRFTYERGKTGNGGKWLTIIFRIYKNERYIDQFCLDEFIQLPDSARLAEAGADEEYREDQYQDDNMSLLADACNNEFTPAEMDVIFSLIADKPMPQSNNGIWIARFHYLTRKYVELEYRAQKNEAAGKPIKNRFAYFKAMLNGDDEE